MRTDSPSPGGFAILSSLAQAGVLQGWRWPVLGCLGALAAWEVWQTGRPDSSPFLLLLLTPFFAGTGILGAARLGRFDLLSGLGVSRRRILGTALAGTLLPLVVTVAVAALLGDRGVSGVPVALCGCLFAFGVGFLGGLRGPAAIVGSLWTIGQVVYFLSPGGRNVLMLLLEAQQGGRPVPLGRLAIALGAFPELAGEAGIPPALVFFAGVVGLACVVVAFAWFERADWPGKRMG